jgi:MFS transporter, MHS family, shikimate and dehydroshikimate transport protein
MERLGGEDVGMPTSIRKVVVASFIGTTIEWYDYFIYGTAAAPWHRSSPPRCSPRAVRP